MCELCLLGMRDPSLPRDSVSGASSSADTAMMAIKPSLNWDQVADQIATTGWSTAATSAITYAYRSTNTSDPGFAKFNAAQIQATELALDLWSDVANISFQRVTSNGTAYSNNATILFSADRDSGGYAWAYFPGSTSSSNIAGDVFINTSNGWFTDMAPGSYDFTTIVHEIGHAIGLNHPGAYNGGSPTYAADAEYAQDSNQYTVMSYFDASATGADHGWTSASTPLLHDIAAAQLLYGANMTTRATDTIYGFNSNADKSVFQITGASQDVVFAIWDGGGYDTLDFSGYSDAQVINLGQETFSSVGGLTDNIAIARGVVIENAIGGSGSDTIIGNGLDNVLNGRGGNDALYGGAGNDWLDAGSGNDIVHGEAGDDTIVYDTGDTASNLDGGTGFDTLLVRQMMVPITFSLVAHEFEAARGEFTDTGDENWATRTENYDVMWRLDSSVTVYDNSSRAIQDFDQAGAFEWASKWWLYDALDSIDTSVESYDNGTYAINDYDQANANTWASKWWLYDAQARVDTAVENYDNGTYSISDIDQANANAWSTHWWLYDAAGRADVDVLTYDDGSRAILDIDQANAYAWQTQWWHYNTSGVLDQTVVTYDEGSVFVS